MSVFGLGCSWSSWAHGVDAPGLAIPVSGETWSASEWAAEAIDTAQEDGLPRIPRQQPEDNPATGANDLGRHEQERLEECFEFHPEDDLFLRGMPGRSAAADRQPQRKPRLHGPRERRHDHVRPVAEERVHGQGHGAHAMLELIDQVLLVTPIVRHKHDVGGRGRAVVREIKEIADSSKSRWSPFSTEMFLRSTTMR